MSLVLLLDTERAKKLLSHLSAGSREHSLLLNSLKKNQTHRIEITSSWQIRRIYEDFLAVGVRPFMTRSELSIWNPAASCDNEGMKDTWSDYAKLYSAMKTKAED